MIQAFLQVRTNPMLCTSHHQANTSKRLARWLDRPLFPWKRLVVGFSLTEFALENWLLYRQYRVLQRDTVPKALNKEIEKKTFDKSQVCRWGWSIPRALVI